MSVTFTMSCEPVVTRYNGVQQLSNGSGKPTDPCTRFSTIDLVSALRQNGDNPRSKQNEGKKTKKKDEVKYIEE